MKKLKLKKVELGELNENLIGTELGQFKLENEFKEIVFLGPGTNLGNPQWWTQLPMGATTGTGAQK